jgi:hypothetical protein
MFVRKEKHFFFGKKKQKTSIHEVIRTKQSRVTGKSFLVLFFKKERLPFPKAFTPTG